MNKPIKIAFILYSHSFGGAETRYFNALKELGKNGDLEIVLYSIPRLLDYLENKHGELPKSIRVKWLFPQSLLPFFDWTESDIYHKLHKLPVFFTKLLRAGYYAFIRIIANNFCRLDENQYDIIQSVFFVGPIIKTKSPQKHLCSVVNTDPVAVYPARLLTRLIKGGLSFEFLSGSIKDKLIAEYPNIKGVNYAVAPCSFIDYSQCSTTDKKMTVAFVGRLELIKQPLLFVEACLQVAQKYPQVKFLIIGEGRETYNVNKAIREFGLEERFEVGFNNFPAKILSEVLIYVACQKHNNYPSQALLESMACSCAVVATNVGETSQLISQKTGLLVEESAEDLARGISYFLENPEKANQLGFNANQLVSKEFTVERYAEHMAHLYQKMMKN